jgi:hypothetical protein
MPLSILVEPNFKVRGSELTITVTFSTADKSRM